MLQSVEKPVKGSKIRESCDSPQHQMPAQGAVSCSSPLSTWSVVVVLSLGCMGSVWAADPAAPAPVKETKQQRDARMAWFRDAKFGLFIHWGVYSVPAGEWKDHKDYAEWFLEQTQMPVSQYEKYRDQFNPVKFDARQWVAVAKEAGVKYLVITSKHHDGFAMFDTKLTDWGIMSSPFHRDPMKELAAACREAGIKFCFYHSIMDWHHPDYMPRREWNDVAKAQGEPQFDRYEKFLKGQLKELLTNYGPLGILWFDGEWEKTWTHERGKDLEAYVRGLQPDIIINNRVGKNREGMKGLSKGDERTRRLRHARAADSRRRPARRRLGIVHDHERPLGLQQERPELEIVGRDDPHVDRHRQQGRQPADERRADLRRADSRAEHRAAPRDRHVDEAERRGHLWHAGQPAFEGPRLGPRHAEAGQALLARLRLAQGRPPDPGRKGRPARYCGIPADRSAAHAAKSNGQRERPRI